MKKRTLAFVASGVVCSGAAHAQEIFTQGGTQGIGIGAAFALGSRFGVHADFNGMNFEEKIPVKFTATPKAEEPAK